MKTLEVFFLSLCVASACGQTSQDWSGKAIQPAQAAPTQAALQSAIPEPAMADIFYRLDGEKLLPLERQAAAIHSGAHGFVVVTMKSASEFPGLDRR
jgi:hypothetical protein